MDNDAALRLAYDASVRAVNDQAQVLEALRSRAGTMFAAAALVASLLGGQVLDRRSFKLVSFAGTGVGFFVMSALFTLVILWPFRFRLSVSASDIIQIVDERRAEHVPVTDEEAYRELALRLEVNYDRNSHTIKGLFWCFRLAILSMVAEVALWIAAAWRT